MPDKHYVTVKAAIWKEGKLLLLREIKKGGGHWDLPGGRLDKGEDIFTGLTREIKEEVGVGVKSISRLPVKVWNAIGNHSGDSITALLYEVELESEDFQFEPGDENEKIVEAQYLTAEEFVERTTPDFIHSKFITQYFKEKNA